MTEWQRTRLGVGESYDAHQARMQRMSEAAAPFRGAAD